MKYADELVQKIFTVHGFGPWVRLRQLEAVVRGLLARRLDNIVQGDRSDAKGFSFFPTPLLVFQRGSPARSMILPSSLMLPFAPTLLRNNSTCTHHGNRLGATGGVFGAG